jgi:hypothetical protein
MRTRMLRLTATAGATALLAGIGAVATAGTASAATAPTGQAPASTVVTTHYGHHDNDCDCCWRWTPSGWMWVCEHDWDNGWGDDHHHGGYDHHGSDHHGYGHSDYHHSDYHHDSLVGLINVIL